MRDVQSPQCFSLALGCLDDCIKNHQKCPKPTLDARLPTRVIDCSDPSHPKLFASQGTNASYVALSYVWGGTQPNCTTTKNLEIYTSAGIDLDFVPETIQDAIQATNRLGFRYLWVDAFCIIQNSAEDKKTELIQLRRIFRDAHFTIIASCAESASVGFLKTRAPPANSPPRLPFWCKDGRLGIVSTHPMFAYDARDEPANQRAWCLEERLLSARKLVYASDTLYYHCQSTTTSIGNSISIPRRAERLLDVMFLPDNAIGTYVQAEWKRKDWRQLEFSWADVIRNYTAREVTKPKDKLTALAGVTEQFERVWYPTLGPDSVSFGFGGEGIKSIRRRYFAGLWKHSLKRDLLWYRFEGTPNPRPSQYLAPSWSWASVKGPISLMRGMDDRLDAAFLNDGGNPTQIKSCEILSCDVEVEDERLPHGRVKSSMLKIRSKTVPTTWAGGSYDSEFGLFVGKGSLPGRSVLMVKPETEAEQDFSLRCVADVNIDCTGELEQRLLVVFIMWNTSTEYAHAAGLLVTDINDGKFKRVGFWESTEPVDGTEEDRKVINSWFTTGSSSTLQTLEIV